MPNWKKVIVSGSAAVLSSVTSSFTGSLTGALIGTSSWATNATNATNAQTSSASEVVATVRNTNNATFFPAFVDSNNPTKAYELIYTAPTIAFNPATATLGVANISASSIITTNGFTGSLQGTASWAVSASQTTSASYALTAQTLLGSVSTASYVVNTVTGTNSADLVYGNMADNDQFRIRVGGTATNAGFVEIATADDGTEPIHVRQYSGVFSSLVRTATLLDGSGNSSFPGGITATSFTGSLRGTASYATQALSASYAPGGGAAFPFTGSATITGSLVITGSFDVGVPGANSPRITSAGTLNRGDGISVDWINRQLVDASTILSVDWESRILNDASAVASLAWNDRIIYDTSGNQSVDWESRRLLDNTATRAMDYNSRVLIYPDGTSTALNYGTQNQITMSGSVLVTGSLTVSGSFHSLIGDTTFLAENNVVAQTPRVSVYSPIATIGVSDNLYIAATTADGGLYWSSADQVIAKYAVLSGRYNYGNNALYVSSSDNKTYSPAGFVGPLTGSVFGSASYATQALSASYAPGGGAAFPYTGSARITGSLDVIGSTTITGSLTISGSAGALFNLNTDTLILTGSLIVTGSTAFTGSLSATGSTNLSGPVTIGISNITTNTIASSAAGANLVFNQATGSYTSAKYLYTVSNGANARTGEVIAVWNGTTTQFTDFSTLDIGTTTAVTASVSIVTAQAQFNVQTTNSGWRIKSQVTYL